jgi:sulfide:quinone oxidoreductase
VRPGPDDRLTPSAQTAGTVGQSSSRLSSSDGLRVLIAGGGVAGLETMLALRELAGDLVDVELLSPEHHFWYRPLAVGEPFGAAEVHRFELQAIAGAVGATFTPAAIALADPVGHRVLTTHGAELDYDVLVVACGTRSLAALDGALTFRGPSDVDRLRGLLDELDDGTAKRVAFALPRHAGWPLPLYELALLTAAYLEDRDVRGVELTLVTHENAPLVGLGPAVSDVVTRLLLDRGIALHTSRYPLSFRDGLLALLPDEAVAADRVVALARLEGQPVPGIPQDRDGFVATDRTGRVDELDDVYAAGDITRFPIKQGGIAAQQAVHVAEAIAARAGADVTQQALEPVLHAVLLTGRDPLYVRAEIAAGSGGATETTAEPLFWPPAKISSRYLAPFLASLERSSVPTR